MTRSLIWLYRALLYLYPPAFRAEFGGEMQAIFTALVQEAAHPAERAVLAARELWNGLCGAAHQHYQELLLLERAPRTQLQYWLIWACGAFLCAWVGLYIALDRALAVSRFGWFVAIVLLPGLLVGIPLLWSMPSRRHLLMLAVFVAVTLGGRWVDWDTRKPFLRQLDQVQPGMTVAEVDQIMAGYLRSPGQVGALGAGRHVTYRHTEEAWGNADWGTVTFERGRVLRVEFLPD